VDPERVDVTQAALERIHGDKGRTHA
jgi:hypothetical protein